MADCAHDYQDSVPALVDRFARYGLFAPEFQLYGLNRLQLRSNKQVVDLTDPSTALQLIDGADGLAPARMRLRHGPSKPHPPCPAPRASLHRRGVVVGSVDGFAVVTAARADPPAGPGVVLHRSMGVSAARLVDTGCGSLHGGRHGTESGQDRGGYESEKSCTHGSSSGNERHQHVMTSFTQDSVMRTLACGPPVCEGADLLQRRRPRTGARLVLWRTCPR